MSNPHKVTFKQFAKNINPTWVLDDWFNWPPDIFALCGSIINRTGLYRYCLIDMDWWNNKEWTEDIKKTSEIWIHDCSELLINPKFKTQFLETSPLKVHFKTIADEWENDEIDLDHFRPLSPLFPNTSTKPEKRIKESPIKELAKAILYIYILADASCAGLGLLGQPLSQNKLRSRVFMTVANLHLNTCGSLSTITKFHGAVYPKMRTPRAGMTCRSLTHHLTFHSSEVEVMWRTFPRLDNQKKSLNILAIPYPPDILSTDLEPFASQYQDVRYFKGKTDRPNDDQFITRLVQQVLDCARDKNDIDIIVLPEMALSEHQCHVLLQTLKTTFNNQDICKQLPVIVTGITRANDKSTRVTGMDQTFHNEVRIAVFFAGDWYATTQRKHHRWQLDRSQIRQYELESHFDADQRWFEFSSIAQRRLTILSPNDWLTLTALICEDLARQEPVGEVLRGIGPTLLMALLSDGPQLKERWSARYASVLADDPGTAVLSLTSKGMAERSKTSEPSAPKPTVVGLWKDMIRGWKELPLDKDTDALLFTISAQYEEEYTLDGRSDGGTASVFQLESITPRQIAFPQKTEIKVKNLDRKNPSLKPMDEWNNIRELSALQYAIEGIIDIISDQDYINENREAAIKLILGLLEGKVEMNTPNPKFRERIISCVAKAWDDPYSIGIAARKGSTSKMTSAVQEIRTIFDPIRSQSKTGKTVDIYDGLIRECIKKLEHRKTKDQDDQVPMTILYNLYNRVVNWQPVKSGGFLIDGLDITQAIDFQRKIMDALDKNRKLKEYGTISTSRIRPNSIKNTKNNNGKKKASKKQKVNTSKRL